MKYTMTIAGVERDLALFPVSDKVAIAAFILLGDAELTTACAEALLARLPAYDYLLTAEAKSIPLIHEMARQHGDARYFVARKDTKVYLANPLTVTLRSITTQHEQHLYLGGEDAKLLANKRVLIVDDVISTGESLAALEKLVEAAGGIVCGRAAVLAEGDAADRADILYLEKLPLFTTDGEILA